MKRKTMIASMALVAVLGTAMGASAHGFGGGKGEGRGPGAMGPRGPQVIFSEMDANDDGKVTQEEIDAFKAARFAEIDTDGNGIVSAEELAAHHETKQADRMKDRAGRMLERLDTDGDGGLSAEELAAGPEKGLIERLDTDGDGAVSEEELAEMKQRFMDKRGGGMGKPGEGRPGPARQ